MAGRHHERIMKAIDYMETHLSEHLNLDEVAAAVHYSKYHLHRMFSKMTGLTIHEYIQRRRLTEAAKLLVFSDRPILEIALLSGYESQQAFTSTFTAMYKVSPFKYRENERFYPLQLRFVWKDGDLMPMQQAFQPDDILFATEEDIPCWMELVRLVIDGFPHLYEEQYVQTLTHYIRRKEALLLKKDETAIGVMLFSCETGSIDFMGTHPLYRQQGIPKIFLEKVMKELAGGREISITTYREGDKADTGHRKEIMALGFAEAELVTEFGYPTQRFIFAAK